MVVKNHISYLHICTWTIVLCVLSYRFCFVVVVLAENRKRNWEVKVNCCIQERKRLLCLKSPFTNKHLPIIRNNFGSVCMLWKSACQWKPHSSGHASGNLLVNGRFTLVSYHFTSKKVSKSMTAQGFWKLASQGLLLYISKLAHLLLNIQWTNNKVWCGLYTGYVKV